MRFLCVLCDFAVKKKSHREKPNSVGRLHFHAGHWNEKEGWKPGVTGICSKGSCRQVETPDDTETGVTGDWEGCGGVIKKINQIAIMR